MDLALRMALEVGRTRRLIAAFKALSPEEILAERELNRKLSGLFTDAFNGVLDQMVDEGVVPPGDDVRLRLVRELRAIDPELVTIFTDSGIDSADRGRKGVVTYLNNQGEEIQFGEMSPRVKELIQQHAFRASRYTMNRVTDHIMTDLAGFYEAGIGIDSMVRSLRASTRDLADWKLMRIARTETNTFQNVGAFETMEELKVEYVQWWATKDDRVRSSHDKIHGQIVKRGDRFSNGLRHPGDRDGTKIEEWIQCRCRIVPFIMPRGKMAPPGKRYFFASDLVDVVKKPKPNPKQRKATVDAKPKPQETPKPKAEKPKVEMYSAKKTILEAQTWMKAKYPWITFDFAGAHIDTINPTAKQLDRLLTDWPFEAKKLNYVGTYKSGVPSALSARPPKFEDSTYAHCYNYMGILGLNTKYYSNPWMFKESMKSSAKSGWLTGDGSIESILTHEFGHHWDGVNRSSTRSLTGYYDDMASRKGTISRAIQLMHWDAKPTAKLSRYSTTLDVEGMSEAMSAYYHGGGTGDGFADRAKGLFKAVKDMADSGDLVDPDKTTKIQSLKPGTKARREAQNLLETRWIDLLDKIGITGYR